MLTVAEVEHMGAVKGAVCPESARNSENARPGDLRANAVTPGMVTHPRFQATVAPEYA
jgi:hypothetical protein